MMRGVMVSEGVVREHSVASTHNTQAGCFVRGSRRGGKGGRVTGRSSGGSVSRLSANDEGQRCDGLAQNGDRPYTHKHRLELTVPGRTRNQTKSEETTLTLENLLDDLMGILEHLFPDPKDAPSLVVSRVASWSVALERVAPSSQSCPHSISPAIYTHYSPRSTSFSLTHAAQLSIRLTSTFRRSYATWALSVIRPVLSRPAYCIRHSVLVVFRSRVSSWATQWAPRRSSPLYRSYRRRDTPCLA
jgi:hypothetical protein